MCVNLQRCFCIHFFRTIRTDAAREDASAQRTRANRLAKESEVVRAELSSVAKDLRTRLASTEADLDDASTRVRRLENDLAARDAEVSTL